MPQPSKIPLAFAASGDRNSIPESTETAGLASWQEGFPAITSTPFSEGGIAPKRADFNGIFNALSLATLWQQQGGFYAYDNATDYEVGNVVLYSGDLYKCLNVNGPSSSVKAPTNTTAWAKIIVSLATQSANGYMSAADKAFIDSLDGMRVEVGSWSAASISAGGLRNFSPVFSSAFTSPPEIFLGITTSGTTVPSGYGPFTFVIESRSVTGFTGVIVNNSSTARSPVPWWVAIGK